MPSHINLAANTPSYVRESDDFQLISWWLQHVPRSGRSYFERALHGEVRPAAISGGTVLSCFSEGEHEMGPIGLDSHGAVRDWNEELIRMGMQHMRITHWSGRWLSETLPLAFSRCFSQYVEDEDRFVSAACRSPRCFWRTQSLPRTSLSRCVACLARELSMREDTQGTAAHYDNCLRNNETESWRRMRPSTRNLVFRQHSCLFGGRRATRWHGLLLSTQRDVQGGALGWMVNIRVYVTAAIPAAHPEMYNRGSMNIDLVFPFPSVFQTLLGREVQMRGRLHWEGNRASRAQSMLLMWVPFPGDGLGMLGGLIYRRRWIFESDFWYADRPDVMVTSLALQLCGFERWEVTSDLGGGSAQYPLPRAAREQRRRRNDKCEWWEGKKTGRCQRLSDYEDEAEGPSMRDAQPRDRRVMRHMAEARTLSLTQPSASSHEISSLPTAADVAPPLPVIPLFPPADENNDDVDDDNVAEDA